MFRFFSLMIALYPAKYRAEFGDEMRAVLGELGNPRDRLALRRGSFSACCGEH